MRWATVVRRDLFCVVCLQKGVPQALLSPNGGRERVYNTTVPCACYAGALRWDHFTMGIVM